MKMILTLTKNEYIKLFKRRSVPILLALLLLMVFGISLIKTRDNDYYYGNMAYEKQYYDIKMSEDEINKYKNDYEKAYAYAQNYINKEIEDTLNKAEMLGIYNSLDWRYDTLNSIINMIHQIGFNDYVASGGEYSDLLKNNLLDQTQYQNIKKAITEAWKSIKENNYSESHRPNYESAKLTLDMYKKQLEKAEKEKIDGKDSEDVDFKIFKLTGSLKCSENVLKAYEYLLENNYSYNSTEDKMFKTAVNNYSQAATIYSSLQSEEDYLSGSQPSEYGYRYEDRYYYNDSNLSYEEYYQRQLDSIKDSEDKGAISLYSIENGVTEFSLANKSRLKSLSFVNMFWFIAPLAIFFASGIVSKEFSTKTINLLLLRPVKRWKILLSKYLCILSLTFGIIVAAFGLYLLGSGIRLSFADLAQPYMFVSGDEVITVNFILWFIGKIALASIPVLFLISLTFMLSTLTKSTAVSIILSVLTLFSSILILIFFEILRIAERTYYPFPYFSMWSYVLDDIKLLSYNTVSIFAEAFKEANIIYGIIILLTLTVITVAVSFTNFIKKDVK